MKEGDIVLIENEKVLILRDLPNGNFLIGYCYKKYYKAKEISPKECKYDGPYESVYHK